MTSRALYRGFSTANHRSNPSKGFITADMETVKQDLLNHIYTIPGERVMMPSFGTRIPEMAFEPLDQNSLDIIESDLRRVVNYDPRVELIDISVNALPNNNAVVVYMDLRYLELGVTETMKLEFTVGS